MREYGMGEGLRTGITGQAGKKHYDEVITAFLDGRAKKGSRMHTDGHVLYSYDTAIAKKQSDGTILINNTKYSSTTQKQVKQLESQVKSRGTPREYTGEKDFNYAFEDFPEDNYDTHNPLHRKIAKDR